jgi:hypothetical protein
MAFGDSRSKVAGIGGTLREGWANFGATRLALAAPKDAGAPV